MFNPNDQEVVPGVRVADLPSDRDQLWDFADTWINARGAAMDTWDRETAWAAIVAAVSPDWVVGLTERHRLQRRDSAQRIHQANAERRAERAAAGLPNPIESKPTPGQRIRLVFEGQMSEPFTVTGHQGRSDEHLVLSGPCGLFEHYWDPYNTYPA
jgi:hypothetical protein